MKLYSWNVNGIRAVLNKGTFQKFIIEHDPDILCLQETKANRDQVEIDLPQYHEHFFSAVKKAIAVPRFSQKNLRFATKTVFQPISSMSLALQVIPMAIRTTKAASSLPSSKNFGS